MTFKIFTGLKSYDGAQYQETREFPEIKDAELYAYGLACNDFEEHFDDYFNSEIGSEYIKQAINAVVPDDVEEEIFFEELMNSIINSTRDKELDYFVELVL